MNSEFGMKGKFITVSPAVDLHYVEAGTGDLCLVLVPGWTMSVEVFEHQLAHYADSNTVRCTPLIQDPTAEAVNLKMVIPIGITVRTSTP